MAHNEGSLDFELFEFLELIFQISPTYSIFYKNRSPTVRHSAISSLCSLWSEPLGIRGGRYGRDKGKLLGSKGREDISCFYNLLLYASTPLGHSHSRLRLTIIKSIVSFLLPLMSSEAKRSRDISNSLFFSQYFSLTHPYKGCIIVESSKRLDR